MLWRTIDLARLQSEIQAEQKTINQLSEERAPVAAEVRKVEAEVGPIKYIAAFFYGNTDPSILEKAVTWVIITLIVVFDPLAVILLLASQMSFQNFRERTKGGVLIDSSGTIVGLKSEEGDSPKKESDVVSTATVTNIDDLEPVEFEWEEPFKFTGGFEAQEVCQIDPAIVDNTVEPINCNKCGTELVDAANLGLHCPNPECGVITEPDYDPDDGPLADTQIEQIKETVKIVPVEDSEYVNVNGQLYHRNAAPAGYVQNEEQKVSNLWTNTITSDEYLQTSKNKKA